MRDNIADIRVFGVGGGGCNALNKMINDNLEGVSFFAVNTDAQALHSSNAKNQLPIGTLGAGADPKIGKKSATDHVEEIKKALKGADMVYITAGMGGGTGTGAAPVIAEIAKQMGILTVAIVTTPFMFEGPKRNTQARQGIKELEGCVDSLIIVSNDKLLQTTNTLPLKDSFAYADEVLKKGVCSVVDIIQSTALINLDFADVKSIMSNAGKVMIGVGEGKGEHKAEEAAKNALNSPLLEVSPKGATKAIINVTGGRNMSIQDANKAVEYITEATNSELDTIFGVNISEEVSEDKMVVTIILTGLNEGKPEPIMRKIKHEKAPEVIAPEIISTSEPRVEKPIERVQATIKDEEIISFNKPEPTKTRRRVPNPVDERDMDSFLKRFS